MTTAKEFIIHLLASGVVIDEMMENDYDSYSVHFEIVSVHVGLKLLKITRFFKSYRVE